MNCIKRFLFLLVLVCLGLVFVGCEKSVTKVGILQLATHPALGAAKDGFIQGLEDAGFKDGKNIEIILKNPEGDSAILNQMAADLVRSCDIVLAIATPAAIAVQTAAETNGKDIPILFTAVTDAVDAQLVASNEKPGGNITGTSDINPVTDQIDLMKELLPGIKKFGILYNASEPNSIVQARLAKEEAAKHEIAVIEKTVTDVQGLPSAVQQLINDGAEAFYLPTDNLVATSMPTIVEKTNAAKVPTVCGEGGMVSSGGSITYGINYFNLGKQTAAMAAKIINGTKPADIPVETQPAAQLEVSANLAAFEEMGIVIPDSIKNRLAK